MANQTAADDLALATSFEIRAEDYARLRPGYPTAAVDAALPGRPVRVLDLGAGTGKLTESLLDRGLDVIAVEPLWGMVAQLHRLHPRARAVCGSAEHLPMAASSVDAIVAGQAFHWFDPEPALNEMARVLRPGGTLALLWNHDDEADPLVRDIELALNAAGRPAGGSTGRGSSNDRSGRPPFDHHDSFTDPALIEVAWTRELTVDDLIGLVGTYSYVIRADDRTRSELETRVRAIIARAFPDGSTVRVPVICQVWIWTCR